MSAESHRALRWLIAAIVAMIASLAIAVTFLFQDNFRYEQIFQILAYVLAAAAGLCFGWYYKAKYRADDEE